MSDQPNVRDDARRATYQDVLDAPEEKVAEIIDGELVLSPRPALRHANFSSGLGTDLGGPFQRGRSGPGGWILLDEPELHFGRNILVPDLAGWRRERLPQVPDAPFLTLAPDWVCEVLSPATAGRDRTRKLPIYAREKVGHVWLADPALRTLEVLALVDERWSLVAAFLGDEKVRAPPFEAVELELAPLWNP
jgi:Uma2 family endonuclease